MVLRDPLLEGRARLGLAGAVSGGLELGQSSVQPPDLGEQAEDPSELRFAQLGAVGSLEELVRDRLALPESLGDIHQSLPHHGDRHDGAPDPLLAAFDPLAEIHLLVRGQQRDAPDLAEIEPDRVLGAEGVLEGLFFGFSCHFAGKGSP